MSPVKVRSSITIREGTTDRIIMRLLADDVGIDLTDIQHVELELRDKKRGVYRFSSLDASPQVGVYDAAEGEVYFDPPSAFFKALFSPYLLYWLVFSVAQAWFSVPEETEAMIEVRRNV